MTKLHFVKKARKAIKGSGIKVGDSYYWWKFAFGSKQSSKSKPRRSQLTQSEFYGAMYDFEDQVAELDTSDPSAMAGELESIADEIESLGSEQTDKRDNNARDAARRRYRSIAGVAGRGLRDDCPVVERCRQ